MIMRILAGSVVALGLGLASEAARADETFICGDGRMLQVALGDLQRLKRQDPCVAAHYGIVIRAMPLPVKRPPPGPKIMLKGAQAATKTSRDIGVIAEVATDYRNVRILNAAPGNGRWFTHKY